MTAPLTVPLQALLFFTGWTLALVVVGVASYRLPLVFFGAARANAFPSDQPHGPDLYRRLLRAHANCVENLPIFAVLVIVGHVLLMRDGTFALLAQVVAMARVGQSVAHIASGRSLAVMVRFAFFSAQVGAMIAMGATIVRG